MMKKSCKFLEILAAKVEGKYGPAVRDRIFGDIPRLPVDSEKDAAWLQRFLCGIHDLNDVDFTAAVKRNMHRVVQREATADSQERCRDAGVAYRFALRYPLF